MENISTKNKSRPENEPTGYEIVEHLHTAVYTCNRDGYITFYNKAAAVLWGREPEIGRDMWCGSWKIYRPDGSRLPLDECPMAMALKDGRPVRGVTIIVERPDGERHTVSPYPEPLFDASGQLTGAVNLLVDITSILQDTALLEETKLLLKKQVEEKTIELKKSEQRYHSMIDEVNDYAILLLNTKGEIQNWNKGAEKIKGYSAGEIVGRNFRLFYTKEDQQLQLPETLIAEASANGKANHEGWRVKKDGTTFWGSIVITALHDTDNRIIGFSKVTRDLTDRKMAEDALKEKSILLENKNKELEKMNSELSSFVYISSHDLQEPLRKIQTFSSYIAQIEINRLSDKGKDFLHRMEITANRMQSLVRDLLIYSRTSATDTHFEAVPTDIFLQGAKDELKEMIEEKKAVIESGPLPVLNVIPFQFQQLFINILSNSLKYAKKKLASHIVIRAGIVNGSDAIADTIAKGKKYHHISFTDNGIGFSPEYNLKVFEIFQRLHKKNEYSGTGIGLAICRKIAENHQGFITAEGQPDKGVVIHVYLPLTPTAAI